jgi:hypothetical protein
MATLTAFDDRREVEERRPLRFEVPSVDRCARIGWHVQRAVRSEPDSHEALRLRGLEPTGAQPVQRLCSPAGHGRHRRRGARARALVQLEQRPAVRVDHDAHHPPLVASRAHEPDQDGDDLRIADGRGPHRGFGRSRFDGQGVSGPTARPPIARPIEDRPNQPSRRASQRPERRHGKAEVGRLRLTCDRRSAAGRAARLRTTAHR